MWKLKIMEIKLFIEIVNLRGVINTILILYIVIKLHNVVKREHFALVAFLPLGVWLNQLRVNMSGITQ